MRSLKINHETNIQLTGEFIRLQTIRAAQNLQQMGFMRGDIIGIVAKNSHYVAPIVFASICIGCTILTFDTSFNKSEYLHMLKQVHPKIMFCDANVSNVVQECLNELEIDAKIFLWKFKAVTASRSFIQ